MDGAQWVAGSCVLLTMSSSGKVKRRICPGTTLKEANSWDSSEVSGGQYAVLEYIQTKVRADPSDIEAILKRPSSFTEPVWIMEHLR